MSLINPQSNPVVGHEVVETQVIETETEQEIAKPVTDVSDIKKQYFPSAKLVDAQPAIDKVMEIADEHGLNTVFNFDAEAEFPEGYGVAIAPIQKTIKKERVIVGVVIAAIPDIATIEKHERGAKYVNDAVIGSMLAKLMNAVRPKKDSDEGAPSIPFSVEDYITSNRAEGVLLAYRAFAAVYVKVLKDKGLTLMNESILRQILQSAAFAEQHYPNVPQAKWMEVLDSMINRANQQGIAVGLLAEWKTDRDSAKLKDVEIDLSDLNFDAIGSESDESKDDSES